MSTKNEQLPEQPKGQNDGKQTQPTPKPNMFKLEKTTIAKLGRNKNNLLAGGDGGTTAGVSGGDPNCDSEVTLNV
jgi:hypothetical protein